MRYGVDRRHGRWFKANEAHALFELGRLDDAERLARSAGEHRYLGTWTVITKVESIRGRFEAAREACRRDDLWNSPLWRLATETFIERAAGNFDGVRARMDEAEAERRTSELVAPVWQLLGTGVGAAADHAVAARRRRRPTDAAEAVRLGCDWLGQLREIVEAGRANGGAGRFCEATLATAEGEMERLEERFDPATWASAARQWRALPHPYETAYAELRLAEALLATDGDRVEVTSLLRDAHAATITLGAVPLRDEIETVARHAKVELAPEPGAPSADLTSPVSEVRSSLTARERDVLRLVAEGHTNREIGDRLFISEKTASVHVSNAMAKLGALSRYEAAAAAERTGQLS